MNVVFSKLLWHVCSHLGHPLCATKAVQRWLWIGSAHSRESVHEIWHKKRTKFVVRLIACKRGSLGRDVREKVWNERENGWLFNQKLGLHAIPHIVEKSQPVTTLTHFALIRFNIVYGLREWVFVWPYLFLKCGAWCWLFFCLLTASHPDVVPNRHLLF
jgi:hypothetical protein